MTDAQIIASIRARGYPADPDLGDAEIEEAIAKTQRDLLYQYPLQTFGKFTINFGQQEYDLFNPVQDLSKSQGVFPGGIAALQLVWSPAGTTQGLSVFGIAPFLQGMTILPGEITVYSFNTPADWWIWDANWSSFVNRFGEQPFEHLENRPGAGIRVFPVPKDTQTGFLKFKKYRDPLSFQTNAEDESGFLMMVEAECGYIVHRKLAMVAGAQLGRLKAGEKPALYWKMEADRLYKRGWEFFYQRYYDYGSAASRT